MAVFALCCHQRLPWSAIGAGGLLLAAIVLGRSLLRGPSPAALLGLTAISRRTLPLAAGGCLIGVGLGCLHRWNLGLPPLPSGRWEAFAVLACLIGSAEELVYRGWLQGRLHVLGRPAAVAAAAASHATYKTLLFAWPLGSADVDLLIVGFWTFAGGVVFGTLRERAGNIIPAVLAHAVFDLMIYGAIAHAPWWVWS